MNNYRPVSKLSFLSKVPEKTVFIQFFTIHLTDKNLFEKFQSAFRFLHSTETALLKVCNNLLLAEDSEFSILVILNLSVVFNPVYHNGQEWWAGLTEVALTCLSPILKMFLCDYGRLSFIPHEHALSPTVQFWSRSILHLQGRLWLRR